MKYLSLIVLVVVMAWSWKLIQTEQKVSEQIHQDIQKDLKKIIVSYIQEKLPDSENIQFKKMWTEQVSKDQIKANFTYSFKDNRLKDQSAQIEMRGSATLNRSDKSNAKVDVWNFDGLKIDNEEIEFDEGMTITASEDLEEDNAPTGPQPTNENPAPPDTQNEGPDNKPDSKSEQG